MLLSVAKLIKARVLTCSGLDTYVVQKDRVVLYDNERVVSVLVDRNNITFQTELSHTEIHTYSHELHDEIFDVYTRLVM